VIGAENVLFFLGPVSSCTPLHRAEYEGNKKRAHQRFRIPVKVKLAFKKIGTRKNGKSKMKSSVKTTSHRQYGVFEGSSFK